MRKVRITTGLSCLMAFILCFVIFGSNLAMSYDTVVNGMLGVQTSKVINDESVEDEDTIYYKSAYGDINAKTLKVLKEDTYTEAVQEQEEGTVLLYNKDNALPLSKDEQISLFGHAVVQPLYRNQSAGSRAYSTKTGVDLYKALGTLKFKVNPKLYNAYRQSKTERKTGAGTFFAENADPSALWSLGEEPISFYTDDVKSSWATGFNDVAIVMLAREGGEGVELYTQTPTEGTAAKAFHFTGSFDDETYRYSATGVRVTNQFEDADVNYWYPDLVTYLSRSDWQGTYPVQPVAGLTLNDEMIRILDGKIYEKPDNAPAVDAIPQGDQQGIMLITMKGLDYNDDLWETFISQMTIEEMAALIANNFGTEAVDSVGKPATPAGDGPDGIGGYTDNYSAELGKGLKTTSYPNESLLTAAFNKDLLDKRGALLGEEGLFMGLVEIWGPGCNLHRTPFGGRSFEYFSEDANLNYLAASHIVSAIEEKGVHAGPKHLTGNDQENNRQGVVNFFNEQAFREGALRGLEGGVVNGKAHSLMQAFNRLGFTGCSLSKALNTDVVRGEWGYVGHIETDAIGAVTTGYKTAFEAMMAAGTDSFCLDTQHQSSAAIVQAIRSNNDGFMLQQLRRAAKNILYNDANSSMMNGIGNNTRIVKIIPWWQPALRGVTIGVSVVTGLAVLAMLAAKLAYYKKQKGAEKK